MIKPETLQFLVSVSENNNREWFQKHKEEYLEARGNCLEFTQSVIQGILKFDNTIPNDLKAEDCVMRIYRDIRFSKDKTPYKTNFGIAISANGKNFNGPGYYLHIQPGSSFVAGGSWYPEKDQLKAIRQEIDYNSAEFLEIVRSKTFLEYFEGLDTEGKLRSAPKGYESNHDLIEYLKLKCFVASKKLTDEELQESNSVSNVTNTFNKLTPLMIFLRNAIS